MRFRNIPTAIRLAEDSNDLLLIPDIYLLSMLNESKANETISCYHIVTGSGHEEDDKWVLAAAYQENASRLSSSARIFINLLSKDKTFFDRGCFEKRINNIVMKLF